MNNNKRNFSDESIYKLLFDNATEMILIIQDNVIKMVNPAFYKTTGLSEDDIIDEDFLKYVHPNDKKKIYERQEKRIKGEKVSTDVTFRIINKKSEIRWVEAHSTLINLNNKPATLSLLNDVTEKFDLERKYQTLYDSIPSALLEIDFETVRVISLNNEMEKRFPVPKEALIGKHAKEFLPNEVFENRFQAGLEAVKKNKIVEFTDEREGRYNQTLYVPVTYATGKKTILVISSDITKIKEAEEKLKNYSNELKKEVKSKTKELQNTFNELKESEEKYRLLFEKAPIGIAIFNTDGSLIDINPSIKQVTGLKISKKPVDFSIIIQNKKERNKLFRSLNTYGKVLNYEVNLKKLNGNIYHAILDINTIKIKGKNAYLVIERDITELKKKEEQLREAYSYLQNTIDSASEIILSFNKNHEIEMVNRFFEKISGYTKKELQKKPIDPIVENPSIVKDTINNLSKGAHIFKDTLTITTKSKEKRLISFSASKISAGEGGHDGYLIIGKDITVDASRYGKLIPGFGYLIVDEQRISAFDTMNHLHLSDYKGLLLSRGNLSFIKDTFADENLEIISYKISHENSSKNYLQKLYLQIEKHINNSKKSVILIDRIDYLIMHFSFQDVLQWLYQLSDLISSTQSIILLYIHPHMVDAKDLIFIKSEYQLLPEQNIESISLEDALFSILEFIATQQKKNILVSYQHIGKKFDISKVTTQKRLNQLKSQSLISIKEKGRMKVVSITSKGEALLHKREIL